MSDWQRTYARACTRYGEDSREAATLRAHWHYGHGLAGYGPNGEDASTVDTLEDLAYGLSEELSRDSDSAEELAHALGEQEDYAGAWREHLRAEELSALAHNVSPDRMSAPLYAAAPPELWRDTLQRQLDAFPVDVGEYARLYAWSCSELECREQED